MIRFHILKMNMCIQWELQREEGVVVEEVGEG
jgi:hypothetical protein